MPLFGCSYVQGYYGGVMCVLSVYLYAWVCAMQKLNVGVNFVPLRVCMFLVSSVSGRRRICERIRERGRERETQRGPLFSLF